MLETRLEYLVLVLYAESVGAIAFGRAVELLTEFLFNHCFVFANKCEAFQGLSNFTDVLFSVVLGRVCFNVLVRIHKIS